MWPSIPSFEQARVLVVGDLMLDRYWTGNTTRISPEAPVPVVHVTDLQICAGGAGNVALNVAALGALVSVDGVVGEDEAAASMTELLQAAGVDCRFRSVPGCSTVTKLRVLSRHQQLLRMDFEGSLAGYGDVQLHERFNDSLDWASVVVLSDYAKGTLTSAGEFIRAARAAGKPVLVDPKGNDYDRYRGATILTPNTSELEVVVGTCHSEQELYEKAESLRHHLTLQALLITRGEKGMTLIRESQPPLQLPARAREVFDVTGAGDTVIAVLAAALAAGQDMPEATALANLAAGIVVGKLGAASVSVAELRRAVHQLGIEDQAVRYGMVEAEELLDQVVRARLLGERIVMTNGCFDLLHAGHVRYLAQARELGDRLIVAVNDDASVRLLKGPQRPLTPLPYRMAILAALRSVDWVVAFSEDTPERLICRVRPDLLVKGGDYIPEQIAGADCVLANGGEVRVLDFELGFSTSNILDRIRGGHC